MKLWPGRPHPLGATWDGEGVNFAVYSGSAQKVELCLFDRADGPEVARLALPERTRGAWHGYLSGARPGQLYGFRVSGEHDAARCLFHDPERLLVDPHARAVSGRLAWDDALVASRAPARDTAPFVPKSVVVDASFEWGSDQRPRTPWSRTVIYECHVRGMTMRHPGVPEHLRGTYLGFASDAVIDHLLQLGVTAVELLPVQQHVPERHLLEAGRTNYWGYSPLAMLAPHAAYATADDGRQVREFQLMVKRLHAAGLEVILDVCHGHSCEGGAEGMVVSLRGLDDLAYHRSVPDKTKGHGARVHVDTTGCGNTFNLAHPRGLQLVLDSLRYWITEMHVDGFRFDQAVALARGREGKVDPSSAFLAAVLQDPVISGVKLIAEPWDLGADGYQLGAFPEGWREWNDRFRNRARSFWRGDSGSLPELASRLAGSSDIFGPAGRGPGSSINYVACHDGFTLRDVVSYETKRNLDNGENNRDGADDNRSFNCGVEGETDDPAVLDRRARASRNLLATLAFAQGVPLLGHGDELGRTQSGNNNAYCQDSELTWVDWTLDARRTELLEFARRAFALRREHAVLRRRAFFSGGHVTEAGDKDVRWLRPDGGEKNDADWKNAEARAVGMLIAGEAADYVDERGEPVDGATILLLLNSGSDKIDFALPDLPKDECWVQLLDSASPTSSPAVVDRVTLAGSSIVLLEKRESP